MKKTKWRVLWSPTLGSTISVEKDHAALGKKKICTDRIIDSLPGPAGWYPRDVREQVAKGVHLWKKRKFAFNRPDPDKIIPRHMRWGINKLHPNMSDRKRELILRYTAMCDGGANVFSRGLAWILKITERDKAGTEHLVAVTTIADLIQ